MIDGLLDTCIVIDLERNILSAQTWFKAQTIQFGISRFVWLEVLEGIFRLNLPAQNQKTRIANTILLLRQFPVTEISPQVSKQVAAKYLLFRAAHSGISFSDYFIAETAIDLQIPLYSRNRTHMSPLLDSLLRIPY